MLDIRVGSRKKLETEKIMNIDASDLRTIRDLCAEQGIELKDEDGQPFCCEQRMTVSGGILGPDHAECEMCGKTIGNVASPHINGGHIATDEFVKSGKTWARLDEPKKEETP